MQIIYMVPINNFEWIKNAFQFNEDFMKNHNQKSDEGYFLEKYILKNFEQLQELYNDLPFLPKRMKIGKVEKLVANLRDKTEYVIHIRNLKQALVSKKVHRVIKFYQNAWLKPYIDMNNDLRKKQNRFF